MKANSPVVKGRRASKGLSECVCSRDKGVKKMQILDKAMKGLGLGELRQVIYIIAKHNSN